MAIAAIAGRHDTVKHIDAPADRLDDIFRCAHTHQIMWLVLGHLRSNVMEYFQHLPGGLPYR